MEIIRGEPRRRRTDDEKRAIVAETYAGGAVTAVARRHGINPSMVFGWRKQFREAAPKDDGAFAPVALIGDGETTPPRSHARGDITVQIGVAIRMTVLSSADPELAAAIAKALGPFSVVDR